MLAWLHSTRAMPTLTALCGAGDPLALLLAAVLAANALDVGMLTFGFGLIVFALVYIFWLIKDHFDQRERAAG
jgi:hypothetical protein